MSHQYIDFKALKRSIRFEQVLDVYRVEGLTQTSNGLMGRCPLHGGSHEDEFHVNLERKIYHCFTCGRGGDMISFLKEMEGVSEREAALRLSQALHLERDLVYTADRVEEVWKPPAKRPNPPLPFKLNLDPEHRFLSKRGIDSDTARRFGTGYYSGPGMMHGRVCITINNEDYQPIAYVGRAIDDSLPTYKYPPRFRKSQELFNFWYVARQAKASFDRWVILVQDFFSCMWLHQNLIENSVALMGTELYPDQEHLLLSAFDRITVVMDGDRAGYNATREILDRLNGKIARSVVELPWGAQPDNLQWRDLTRMIQEAKVLDKWVPPWKKSDDGKS